ncbi:BURP domain-containing protein [Zostera marina]|uniref:BURP domain-containing protein n=1 Tax=Zostera marina TaxID=29655 RepID=A0A0K9PVI2_ZOSMR|nr:BURP domain-containing protein [Zostera marina]
MMTDAFLLLFLPLLLSVSVAISAPTHFATTTIPKTTGNPNPLTPKASLLRYWSNKISNKTPKPDFLLSKASPLSALDYTFYNNLLTDRHDFTVLSSHLNSFCSAARLLCFPSVSPVFDQQTSSSKSKSKSTFSTYDNINFKNYATDQTGGFNDFKNYSDDLNGPADSFRRYSRNSNDHRESFSFYSHDGNVPTTNFTSYATSAEGGSGEFNSYHRDVNVPGLEFSNYDASAGGGRTQDFTSYSNNTNSGKQSFSGYGKNSHDGLPMSFTSYANDSNVIESTFKGYGERADNANDSFVSYGFNGNVPENNFLSYADGGKGEHVLQSFESYRDESNVGDDSFSSYLKGTGSAEGKFSNYGQSANIGSDSFKKYGENAVNATVGFKTYGMNNTFADYNKKNVKSSFADYRNTSSDQFANIASVSNGVRSGRLVNRWIEPGKFFRERMLRTGTIMPMADMRDKMPPRSFLPRTIASKLPFSTGKMKELYRIFNPTAVETNFAKSMSSTVSDCERTPSRGETKRCVTSIEDMVDFATSVLGKDVVVRSMESTAGWGENVKIGKVEGINGGDVTKSVSCHQSLFPYMVYYCHAVPKVRVYKAEILGISSEKVINHGVAICHLDTSDWSASHGAFVALGPGPGKIEVCHWIFNGDMTWAVAD